MSEDLLKEIEHFINSGIGDPGRLQHIKESLLKEKTLYISDQNYLDKLVYNHSIFKKIHDNPQDSNDKKQSDLSSEELNKRTIESIQEESSEIDKLKQNMSKAQSKIEDMEEIIKKQESKSNLQNYKSEGATLVLSIVVGLFGVMGVGHLYIGKIKRGIIIMIIGFSLWTVLLIPIIFLGISDDFDESMFDDIEFVQYSNEKRTQEDMMGALIGFIAAVLIVTIGYIVLYIWQIFDSRKLCKMYNVIWKRMELHCGNN